MPSSTPPILPNLLRCGLAGAVLFAAGCRQDMHDQPRYKTYAATDFFGDRRAARPLIQGTVARGQMRLDRHYYEGRTGNALVATLPVPLTRQLLIRGQNRFNIYCTPCHGRVGNGEGMVVERGFKKPPSYHDDRLRAQPVGHFFDVITNGFGLMPSYASRIPVEDRWAIVAYIRALQLSQNAKMEDVPAEKRQELAGAAQ